MKQLYEKDQVFGMIGTSETATAAVALPYALERRMLFFGAFTGANVIRHDPPDDMYSTIGRAMRRRPDAAVRYFVKMRRIPPGRSRSSPSRMRAAMRVRRCSKVISFARPRATAAFLAAQTTA